MTISRRLPWAEDDSVTGLNEVSFSLTAYDCRKWRVPGPKMGDRGGPGREVSATPAAVHDPGDGGWQPILDAALRRVRDLLDEERD